MWTVILHFDRGHSEVHPNLTKNEATEMIRVGVFANEDCVNCSVFKSKAKQKPEHTGVLAKKVWEKY